ncbi:hypothetical protein V6Z12_D09G250600 [Gossypium hirsutum]
MQLIERLPKTPSVSLLTQNASQISSPNAKKIPLLVHNDFEFHIRHQCKSGKINLNDALGYFDKLIKVKPFPSTDTFNHVLGSVLKLSRDSNVISLYRKLNYEGIKPNLCTLNILLSSYYHLRRMDFGFCPDYATVGRLLKGLCVEGKGLEAVQVFAKMRERGFQGDVFTYGILIYGLCSIGESCPALNLFRKMAKRNCEGYLHKLVDEGLNLFFEMVSKGITPDVVVYSSLEAVKFFDEMIGRGIAADLGMWKEAIRIFDRMVGEGISPDEITFTTLISSHEMFAFMRQKEMKPTLAGQLDEAAKLFRSIPDQGYEVNSQKIDEGFQLFRDMQFQGCKPNARTYNTLIQALCRVGRVRTAKKMFDEMYVCGSQSPTSFTYTIMLDGLCKNGHVDEAIALFRSLEGTKYESSIELYSILIYGMCRTGRMEEARNMFNEMSRKGFVPDVVTYNILIDGLCKKGMILEANKLIVEMEEKGCLPNSISFNIIIQGFLRENNIPEAMNLLKEMRRRNFAPNEAVTSLLLNLAVEDSQCRATLESLPVPDALKPENFLGKSL